jgi:hypothetical protein
MKTFKEWVILNESSKDDDKKLSQADSNRINAVMDLAKAIQTVFKKYTLQTRKSAWKKIHTAKAEDLFEKLLTTPNRSLSQFKNIATDNNK